MIKLEVGQRLQNVKDLPGITGTNGVTKSSKFEIEEIIDDSIVVKVDDVHKGVFNLKELKEYFENFNPIEKFNVTATCEAEVEIDFTINHEKKIVTGVAYFGDKKVVKMAKCLPEDEFDVGIGQEIVCNKMLLEKVNMVLKEY